MGVVEDDDAYSLIGRELVAVEVTTSTELDEFTWSHGLDIGEQA